MPTPEDPQSLDGGEFSRLLLRHERDMRALISALVPGCSEVDDILQETSVAMWKKISEYDVARPFRPWALAFARMQVLAWLEKRGRREKRLSRQTIDDLTDRFLAAEDISTLYRASDDRHLALEYCVGRLKDNERKLLRQRYKEGYSVIEIAESEARPRSLDALYKTFSRLHRRLLACVEQRLEKQNAES